METTKQLTTNNHNQGLTMKNTNKLKIELSIIDKAFSYLSIIILSTCYISALFVGV
jgi:hypothetical protein